MSGDAWSDAAQKFYGDRAASKSSCQVFKVFSSAYRPLKWRFPELSEVHVLDVGCGTGFLAASLGSGPFYVAVDISAGSLLAAVRLNPGAHFLRADMTALPVADGAFDFAVAITSLEFLSDKAAALDAIRRALKPGGHLYCEVRSADFLILKALGPLRRLLAGLKILAEYPAEGFRDLSRVEWERLLESRGFNVEATLPALRPWNYGPLSNRFKNVLIALVRALTPVSNHYMIGFFCRKT